MNLPRPVSFPNRDGTILHGMLHVPDGDCARGICVLLLSPGVKGRVGPHRLYLKIAARLVPLGFHVLRFDYSGLGDSEGEIGERMLSDMYNTIQTGRYVGDTISAMDWMKSSFRVERFVGSGLCGGSISALLTAADDKRIESMLALSIPVALDSGPGFRQGDLNRLLRAKTVARVLTGGVNYGALARSLWERLPRPSSLRRRDKAASMPKDDVNPKFATAFLRFVRSRRRMLLIFSEKDRLQSDFERKFEAKYAEELAPLRPYFEVRTIANANHILSDPAWVREMLDMAVDWLGRVHPARPR